jgi:hypothetical protein
MNPVFWPAPPRKGDVKLVRAEGDSFVSLCRLALDKAGISYTMGGRRRDVLTFFVAESDAAAARAAIEKEQHVV